MNILIITIIGACGGIFSGLLGIGGAVVMIPALIFFAGFSQHTAQGTTLCAMVPPIGILAAISYYNAGYADIKTAAVISAAFIIGAYLGSKIAININPYLLKKIFGIVLLYISLKMIIS
jgi:uncharacterized membrane protein YfcA